MPNKPLPHSLTGSQAQYVLDRLLAERRITRRDVDAQLRNLSQDISSLEAQLDALRAASSGASASRGGRAPIAAPADAPKKRRKLTLSPERKAALKRQGHYLALMRQMPKTARAKYSAMFKKQGGPVAIAALRKVLGQ